jgi:hypothetical protein
MISLSMYNYCQMEHTCNERRGVLSTIVILPFLLCVYKLYELHKQFHVNKFVM